jgi:hypothetical protein
MKRLLLGVAMMGASALLGGCPVYPDNGPYSGCGSSGDCGPGYACSPQGQCVAGIPYIPGEDASAPASGCGSCPLGYQCTLAGGELQCLPSEALEDASAINPEDSGSVAPPHGGDASFSSVDATAVDAAQDAFGGPEGGTVGGLCNADTQCVGSGAKCIDGQCTPQGQLCSDGTQCLVAGDSCVDGVCIPPCGTGSTSCPTGYACDFNRGVCSVNPSVCTATAQCQGGAMCVESRCVAPCAPLDAGAECSAGQVCVNGGCIPDQQAQFTCQNEGSSGALANTCAAGSLCLHGDCYLACGGDSGSCAGAGETCKSVRIAKGTYAVCAGASNLGSECDPAVGDYCANAGVCIDGYCK